MYLCPVPSGTLRQKKKGQPRQRLALKNLRLSDNPLFAVRMYYNSAHAPSATKLVHTVLGPAAIMDPQENPSQLGWLPRMPRHIFCALRLESAQQALVKSYEEGTTYAGFHLQRIHLN